MLHHNKDQTKFLDILFRNNFKKEADYRLSSLCSYNHPFPQNGQTHIENLVPFTARFSTKDWLFRGQ